MAWAWPIDRGRSRRRVLPANPVSGGGAKASRPRGAPAFSVVARDEAAAAGDHRWCEELALAVWAHAGRDLRGHHRDTTRVALPGAYVPARDAPARRMPPGDAQDHRPDLPQAVVARLVSHDGGIPVVRQRWAGHPADTQGCRKRAAAVIRACQDTPRPRDRVAAAPRAVRTRPRLGHRWA